ESRKNPAEKRARRRGGERAGSRIDRRTRIGRSTYIGALEEELNAILKIVVKRNLRDGRIDRNLQGWPINLLQRALDNAVAFVVGVDQQVIVSDIRGDSHMGQDGRPRARRGVRRGRRTAGPCGGARYFLAAKAGIKAGGLRARR